jgi:hypothetical protein
MRGIKDDWVYLWKKGAAVFAVGTSLLHDVEVEAIFLDVLVHRNERLENIATKNGILVVVRRGFFGRLSESVIGDFRQGVVVYILGL